MTEIFFIGKTNNRFTRDLLDTFQRFFDSPEITVFLFGKPMDGNPSVPSGIDMDRVYHDYTLDQRTLSQPDPDYLRDFERRYNIPTIWQAVQADRQLIKSGRLGLYHDDTPQHSHDYLLKFAEKRARVIDHVFSSGNIDFVYGQQIMRFGGMLTFLTASGLDIPYFRSGLSRIKNRFTVWESAFEKSPHLLEEAERARRQREDYETWEESGEYIRAVRAGRDEYQLPNVQNELRDRPNNRAFGRMLSFLRSFSDNAPGGNYYYDVPPFHIKYYKLKKYLKKIIQPKLPYFEELKPDETYIYFPLHCQPELTLMIWSRFYTDLVHTVRNIARAIPFSYKLYVNEHPKMLGIRDTASYRAISRVENVRLIAPEVETSEIIEHADAVVTLSSTVGFQSLICDVPTISLGTPFYTDFDSVPAPRNFDELSEVFRKDLSSFIDPLEIRAVIAAMLKECPDREAPDFERKVCEWIESVLQRQAGAAEKKPK